MPYHDCVTDEDCISRWGVPMPARSQSSSAASRNSVQNIYASSSKYSFRHNNNNNNTVFFPMKPTPLPRASFLALGGQSEQNKRGGGFEQERIRILEEQVEKYSSHSIQESDEFKKQIEKREKNIREEYEKKETEKDETEEITKLFEEQRLLEERRAERIKAETEMAQHVDKLECAVCLDSVASVALIPCGHMCVCAGCASEMYGDLCVGFTTVKKQNQDPDSNENDSSSSDEYMQKKKTCGCPLCRKTVTKAVRIFLNVAE